ncbi:MAG: response regulator [bacterium]
MKHIVLLVDDDPGIITAFKKLVKREKYMLFTSSLPEDALAMISKKKPEILILNLKLQGPLGIEFLCSIKKNYPVLPVVVITAYSNIYTMRYISQLGADGYLKMPFDVHEMLDKMQHLIDLHPDKSGLDPKLCGTGVDSTVDFGR